MLQLYAYLPERLVDTDPLVSPSSPPLPKYKVRIDYIVKYLLIASENGSVAMYVAAVPEWRRIMMLVFVTDITSPYIEKIMMMAHAVTERSIHYLYGSNDVNDDDFDVVIYDKGDENYVWRCHEVVVSMVHVWICVFFRVGYREGERVGGCHGQRSASDDFAAALGVEGIVR